MSPSSIRLTRSRTPVVSVCLIRDRLCGPAIPEMSEENREFIQRAFDLIDENHNGRISRYELTRAARVLGYNPTLKEAQSMIDSVDADGEYMQWSSGIRSGFGPRGLGFESWATTRP
ncbi:troponin C, slow skeletal and cardiac muscles [Elysia marginata]|uniref:Troponin C, slow skeletal and cardiac muscles n=1 Tax=Elysia marginata TaxID=1093978 RepID=A0AAV4J8F7_9GAST|nr:troponin C, slow skeletal and cardiac muscles [Elysia marginata]